MCWIVHQERRARHRGSDVGAFVGAPVGVSTYARVEAGANLGVDRVATEAGDREMEAFARHGLVETGFFTGRFGEALVAEGAIPPTRVGIGIAFGKALVEYAATRPEVVGLTADPKQARRRRASRTT